MCVCEKVTAVFAACAALLYVDVKGGRDINIHYDTLGYLERAEEPMHNRQA